MPLNEMLDLLRAIENRKLEVTGKNIWRVLRYRAHAEVVDRKGDVWQSGGNIKDVAEFRLTRRGREALEVEGGTLPFNKNDLPLGIRLWVSSFRRWCRNCPKGLQLTYSDGELHIVATDNEGKTVNDEIHRLASMKVPWLKQ